MSVNTLDHYRRIVESLGACEIERIDRAESGIQCGGLGEYEQDNGAFGFGAMCADDQAALLCAIGENLPTRTMRVNRNTPTSYGLKHTIENYLGFYVSNLQCKTAFHILGYERTPDTLNPHFNISKAEAKHLVRAAADARDRRAEARKRIARRDMAKACGKYFHSLDT